MGKSILQCCPISEHANWMQSKREHGWPLPSFICTAKLAAAPRSPCLQTKRLQTWQPSDPARGILPVRGGTFGTHLPASEQGSAACPESGWGSQPPNRSLPCGSSPLAMWGGSGVVMPELEQEQKWLHPTQGAASSLNKHTYITCKNHPIFPLGSFGKDAHRKYPVSGDKRFDLLCSW